MQQVFHLLPSLNLAKLSRIGNHFSSSPFIHLHLLHSFASDNPPTPSSSHLSNALQGRIPYPQLLQIHARIFRLHLNQDDLIATRLVGHYPPKLALRVFHLLQSPNIFPFNAVIRVLSDGGFSSDAFSVFKRLRFCYLLPNDLTFSFLIKACYGFSDVNCAKQIHTHVVKSVFSDDFFVCNGLLNVYAKKFGDLVSARKVFDDVPDWSMVCCWTSLISGYALLGNTDEVLRLFSMMVMKNLRPENDTMVSVLSACSNLEISAIEKWVQDLSELIDKDGYCKLCCDSVNVVLIYLFGKLGKIDNSRERFEDISEQGKKSVVSWNTMINAYVQNGVALEGLALFRLMIREQRYGSPNHITMVSALSACAQIGDLELGIWIHEHMKTTGHVNLLTSNKNLATALIDMYSKCGCLDKAREIFNQMVAKDVVCFNAMIMGLAVNSEGQEALELFSKMQESFGLRPNANTFLSILCSCSHSGMLEEGRKLFRYMQHFSISPGLEHYACYIDLLARVGCIEEAVALVSSAPFEPNDFVLGALLGGCLMHNRLELASTISNMLVNANPNNSAGYVLLSNALAVDHHWSDVSGVRCFMRENGVSKQPGCSWISINGLVHEFIAGSASQHPQYRSISHVLDELQKEMKMVVPIII